MAIIAAPWRARSRGSSASVASPPPSPVAMDRDDRSLAPDRDVFLDVVVIVSVVLFLGLVVGIAMLALQSAGYLVG